MRLSLALLISLFLLTTSFIEAQNINPEKIKQQFPKEDAVFLQKDNFLKIDFVNGEWQISKQVKEEMLFISDPRAQMYADKTIHYTSFEEIKNIEAKTKVPIKLGRKPKYEEYKVQNFEERDDLGNSIFVSDHKELQFTFPAVQSNAITALKYTEFTKDPHFLGAFFFSSYIPVLAATYTVSFPENVTITHTLLGNETDAIKFEKLSKGGRNVYRWTAKNMAAMTIEPGAPHVSYYEPHVAIYINQVTDKQGNKTEVLKDVSSLYSWYQSLVKDINQEEDNQLKAIVTELLKGADTEEEKVKRIFQWVQQNIKYVAFEDGLGGFIPREAKDVCHKKYGDCKDMSSLTVEMLKIAKIPAWLTWIGTRDRPYSYHEIPSPIVDNHMIATTELNGEYVFLDATGEYVPFTYPTSMIQGKEALIGLNREKFEIVKVPIIGMKKNIEEEEIALRIDGRSLKGSGKARFTGYKKVFTEYARLRAQANNNPHFFDEFLLKGSNKFEVSNLNENGFFKPDDAIEVAYDFEIPSYVTQAGNKIYVNLNLDRKYENGKLDIKKRKLAKENEYKYIERLNIALQIPDGYAVEYLPPTFKYEDDAFGFTIKHFEEDGKIRVDHEVYMNYLLLSKDQFPKWNEMIDGLNEAYAELIVLKKD